MWTVAILNKMIESTILNLMLRIMGEGYANFTLNKQTIEGSSFNFNLRHCMFQQGTTKFI